MCRNETADITQIYKQLQFTILEYYVTLANVRIFLLCLRHVIITSPVATCSALLEQCGILLLFSEHDLYYTGTPSDISDRGIIIV